MKTLLEEIRQCQLCPLADGHRPVVQCSRQARILIAGQAPGSKVHASGVPFDDASGDRLREWLGLSREQFYDPELVALLPMAFCYPGKGKSGDLPPPPLCAQTWREPLTAQLANIGLTIVIGRYAIDWHMPGYRKQSVTHVVGDWRNHPPDMTALVHPSPRNNIWLRRNPWFEEERVPQVRAQVQQTLSSRVSV